MATQYRVGHSNNNNKNGNTNVVLQTELALKTAACFTVVKRTFIFTFILTLLTMLLMYSSSGELSILTLNKVNSFKISDSTNSSRRTYQWISPIQQHNGSVVMNGSVSSHLQGMNSSRSVQEGSLEFPGMPDPCAHPRRRTGVEDLLCMQRPEFLPNYKNPCWTDRGRLRCLPYFHLFGICKSGTSDLFKRIYLHPEIVPNKGIFGKEIWYWSWKRFYTKNRAGIMKLGMTLQEFTDQFYADRIQRSTTANGRHQLITGHGDPMDFWDRFNDAKTPQNTPEAEELLWTTPYSIRHINPDVKLMLMLRDPIDRLYSHYFHSGAGTSAQSFDDHIRYSIPLWKRCLQQHTIRSCIYNPNLRKQLKAPIYTSFYVVHMREWLKVFPRKQILIFRNEDYASDMRATLRNLFRFLEVAPPDDNLLDRMVGLSHFYATKKKAAAGPMLASTRQLLVDLYRPYTQELAELLEDDRFAFRDTSFG